MKQMSYRYIFSIALLQIPDDILKHPFEALSLVIVSKMLSGICSKPIEKYTVTNTNLRHLSILTNCNLDHDICDSI